MPKLVMDNKIRPLQINSGGNNDFYGDKDKIQGGNKKVYGQPKIDLRIRGQPKKFAGNLRLFAGSIQNFRGS